MMAKKKIEIEVLKVYTIEVDEESDIVKEYDSTKNLIEDLVYYNFYEILPVINHGVSVKDSDIVHWNYKLLNS